MARKKNVTFNDIAQYTHFSKTTISRYFNNPDSLTPENQQIISDALDKLNYKENKVAKILANGQTEFVGVLIPSLSMNYYSEMLNQILASYEKYGYMVDYINPNTNEEWGGAGDVAYTKKFAKWIAAESTKTIADEKALALFKKIKLVVSDEANVVSSDVANKLKDDKEFMNAVDVVGYHYNCLLYTSPSPRDS